MYIVNPRTNAKRNRDKTGQRNKMVNPNQFGKLH